MSIWTLDKPPTYFPTAVATDRGWENPDTGEVLVAIGGLATTGGAPEVSVVAFGTTSYAQGDPLGVTVRFSEKVTVTAGATIVVTSDGGGGNVTLYAAAGQTAATVVTFNKQSDNTTGQNVPSNVSATGTLTFSANAANSETVTIGTKVYTFKTAIVDIAASGTLTNDGVNVSNGDTVTIGAKVYTFQSSLTNVDGNVKIGASNTASMTNLFNAINGTGGSSGVDYAALTVAHTQVTATNPTGTTVVVTAIATGTGGNSIASTETSTHLAWGGANLAGGAVNNVDGNVKVGANAAASVVDLIAAVNLSAGAGTTYAVAMTAHPKAVVASSGAGDSVVITAPAALGAQGNSIASTETMGSGAWGAATLTGGVSNFIAATSATQVLTLSGNAANTETVVLGTKTYTFTTAVVDVAASGTLTFSGNVSNNDTVTIDAKTYTFKTTLGSTANQVKIGGSAAASIQNLVWAIQKYDQESDAAYTSATVAHTTVTVTSFDATTLVVTAVTTGTGGNSLASTKSGSNIAWGGSTLAGGATNNVDGNVKVGANAAASIVNLVAAINLTASLAGSSYAALTVAQPEGITAVGDATTVTVTAPASVGATANSYASTETMGSGAWGAATLAGGITAKGTLSVGAQTISGTIVESTGGLPASKTLTFTGLPLDTETVVIDGKTYTFQTTLTNTDGNVKIGATKELSAQNLAQAINLDPVGVGINYATLTTLHSTVSAVNADADVVVTAKSAGTAGNSLAISETLTNGAWAAGATTLSGGTAVAAASKVVSAAQATAAGTRVLTA